MGQQVPFTLPDWPDCMTGDICWLAVEREGWDLNLSRSSVDTGVIKWLWFHPSYGVAKRKTHQNKLQVINKWVFVALFPSVSWFHNLPFCKCSGGLGTATACSVPGPPPWQPSVRTWGGEECGSVRKPLNSISKEQCSWALEQPEPAAVGKPDTASPAWAQPGQHPPLERGLLLPHPPATGASCCWPTTHSQLSFPLDNHSSSRELIWQPPRALAQWQDRLPSALRASPQPPSPFPDQRAALDTIHSCWDTSWQRCPQSLTWKSSNILYFL